MKKRKKENNNSNQEEQIAKYCSIIKNEKKLRIEYNYWKYDRWGILMINLIFVPIGLFILILIYLKVGIIMFFELFGCFVIYLLILLTIGMPLSVFLSAFKNKEEIIIDKDSNTLIKNKVSKWFKQLNTTKYQDIKEVNYKPDMGDFYISIILQNSKDIHFFLGPEDHVKKVGKTIAEFLEKPFYYNNSGNKMKVL